jgi:hypothetical protein
VSAITKSRARVRDHGEVYTPPWLVEKMLDELPDEAWDDPFKTFLEPAMGNGNFVVAIIRRCFARQRELFPDVVPWEAATNAVSRVRGVDILADNVEEARAGVVALWFELAGEAPADREMYVGIMRVVSDRRRQGDFLSQSLDEIFECGKKEEPSDLHLTAPKSRSR